MIISWLAVESRVSLVVPVEDRRERATQKGLKGFDFAHRIKGSVPVQAGDHRKRRCNQVSAKVALTPARVALQSDFALAA
jgi:hypothetical protein